MATHDAGIGRHSSAPSVQNYAGSERQQRERLATSIVGQDGRSGIGRAVDELHALANADQSAAAFAQQQAMALQSDIPTRTGPDIGGHYYLGYSQDELHAMVHNQADPATVNDQGQSFNEIGNALVDIAHELGNAVNTSQETWQGTAADAARGFSSTLSGWHGTTGQGAQLAANHMANQSEALQTARAAMPAPIAMPTTADFTQALMSNPSPATANPSATLGPLIDQYQQAQDNHRQMAQIAQQYDTHLGQASTMPAFATPTPLSPHNSADGTSSTPAASTSAAAARAVTGPHPPNTDASHAAPSSSSPRTGTETGPGPRAPSPVARPAGVPVGTVVPSQPTTPTWVAPTVPSAVTNPSSSVATGGTMGPLAGAGDLAVPIGGGGSPVDAGIGMPPGFGSSDGRGEPPGFGPLGSLGNDNELGGGSRSGVRPSVTAENIRGTANARGAAGEPDTAWGPVGAGRRDEDEEHKRSQFLVEADPNTVFGVTERVAPPVIGE